MKIKTLKFLPLFALCISFTFSSAQANSTENVAFDFWSTEGWTEFSYISGHLNTDGDPDGIIDPGDGGQAFDTEYLFYKYNAVTNEMSIGLQTGFDVIDGKVRYGGGTVYEDDNMFQGTSYYAGDLALSFASDHVNNGVVIGDPSISSSTYEYAIDFGLLTKDRYGNTVESMDTGGSGGVDDAGLYSVTKWDNDINYNGTGQSSPFAMDWSNPSDPNHLKNALLQNTAGSGMVDQDGSGHTGQNLSYWRKVTFSLNDIVTTAGNFTVDAHWTMSCGNDNINGRTFLAKSPDVPGVPEPSVLALFSIGSLSMGFIGYRRRKNIA